MSVTLYIDGGDEPFGLDPIEVPAGSKIHVRRTGSGADVIVLPGAPSVTHPAESAPAAQSLDAEQMVRALGFLLTQHLNVSRHHGQDPFRVEPVTLALAEACGVRMGEAHRNEHAASARKREDDIVQRAADALVEGAPHDEYLAIVEERR